MNNTQRTIALVVGIALAPILFWYGAEENNLLIALGGPVLSLGGGIYAWAGRARMRPESRGNREMA